EMYLTKSIFTRDDVGPNQVVLTVIDPSGNIAECEATVTVVDPFEEEAGVPGDGGEEGGEDPEVILPNTAPTLADVTDIEVMNQALQLDVLLTGISAGSEIDQTVKVTAVADNPSLVSGIAVIYTQGSTGQLLVTVAPGMSGEAWITVTVKDDGGTANGGVDMIQKKFKVKVTHSGEEVTIGITDPDGEEVVTATIDLAAVMGFKLYPNPTRGRVNIEMTGTGIRDTEVSIYTINGTQLFRKLYKAGEQINVDLSPYVSGVYMVRTQSEGVTFLRKVILDK
ncbi:MAG TPA: T9SS type A sorting domain-containing protein, partial [Prolixibacteraceae bacterium]|nr:T9SS type A sorting domain-containing protein [Prolixibacteraceae bacterium]